MSRHLLKPGSVWADMRPRAFGRSVTITDVTHLSGGFSLVDYTVFTVPADREGNADQAHTALIGRQVRHINADEFLRRYQWRAAKATITDEDLAELVAAAQARRLATNSPSWLGKPDSRLTADQLREKIAWAWQHPDPRIGRRIARNALRQLALLDPGAASNLYDQAQNDGHLLGDDVTTCIHCPRAAIRAVHGQYTNLDPEAVYCSEQCRDAHEAEENERADRDDADGGPGWWR